MFWYNSFGRFGLRFLFIKYVELFLINTIYTCNNIYLKSYIIAVWIVVIHGNNTD